MLLIIFPCTKNAASDHVREQDIGAFVIDMDGPELVAHIGEGIGVRAPVPTSFLRGRRRRRHPVFVVLGKAFRERGAQELG
jgi:hypothetical protein